MTGREKLETDLAATGEALPTVLSDKAMTSVPEAGTLGRMIHAGAYVFAIGIVVAAIALLIEVFLRYVFNRPTIWAHETTTFLCALAFLYGGLFCAARDSHIRVVLIYDSLSRRARRIFDIVISATSCIAAGFFAYAAYLMVTKAIFAPTGGFRLERSGSAWDPPTPALVKMFLLGILILMMLQFLVLAINHARRRIGGDE